MVFQVGSELYGTPLLRVREVLEYHQPKKLPGTVPHFLGVMNIRGEIIGIIDLPAKFDCPSKVQSTTAMMVFQTQEGSLAAVVDRVEAVISLSDQDIEKKPNVRVKVPMDYFIGIAKHKLGLITLIDLEKILGIEELVQMMGAS